jgi:hypothetical protein
LGKTKDVHEDFQACVFLILWVNFAIVKIIPANKSRFKNGVGSLLKLFLYQISFLFQILQENPLKSYVLIKKSEHLKQ